VINKIRELSGSWRRVKVCVVRVKNYDINTFKVHGNSEVSVLREWPLAEGKTLARYRQEAIKYMFEADENLRECGRFGEEK